MDSKFFITIGRQLGAGGLEVAGKLSKIFDIPVYDKELLNMASKESGIATEIFENADETPRKVKGGFFGIGISGVGYNDYFGVNALDESELFRIQSDVIRDIAAERSAIFVGRCADYILRDEPRCMSVFITANDSDRVARLRLSKKFDGLKELSEQQVIDFMKKEDKKRAGYYNYYTYKEWGHSQSYNLCLDSSFYGTDVCTEIIAKLAKEKLS